MVYAARIIAAVNAAMCVAIIAALNDTGFNGINYRNAEDWLLITLFILAGNSLAWVMASVLAHEQGSKSRAGRLVNLWLDAKETELARRAKGDH